MTSNKTKKQQAYDRLRKLTSNRVARVLGLADEDLANLSLAQLINLLFLMHGDGGRSDARQHPGNLLRVRERENHLVHKLILANSA